MPFDYSGRRPIFGPGAGFSGMGSGLSSSGFAGGGNNTIMPGGQRLASTAGTNSGGGNADAWAGILAPGVAPPIGNVFDPKAIDPNNFQDQGGGLYTPVGTRPQGSGRRGGSYDPTPGYHLANTYGGQGGLFYGGESYDANGVYRPWYSNQVQNYNPWTENANYDPNLYGYSGG